MKTNPLMLETLKGKAIQLERVESKLNDDRSEEWLQGIIYNNPSILPINYFDETYAPAIPLGREIEAGTGYIDLLFTSPSGHLTIVETKLWKNPEHHRTVVAQIIDYAQELSRWTYDDLNRAIIKAKRKEEAISYTLDDIVKPYLDTAGLALADFQERMILNLKNGEFLLLVVGDRISPNAALLSESIQGSPGLNFAIGLVELQMLQLEKEKKWPLIIVPDIVGRTVEQTRAVVKIQYQQEMPTVEVAISSTDDVSAPKGKINQDIFIQKSLEEMKPIYELWFDRWSKAKNIIINWGTTGFSLRVMLRGKLESIMYAYPDWGVTLIREKDAQRYGVVEQYRKYYERVSSVNGTISLIASNKIYIKHEAITSSELMTIFEATNEFADNIKDK